VKTGRVEGLPAGLYYYHPVEHQLVAVTPEASLAAEAYDLLINRPVFESAAFAIFLVARMSAILSMYGERSLHFATLEAGLMTQLLETVAPSYGLGLCQVGDMDFERIRHLFLLEQSDLLVHSILGGAIAETELVHEQENGGVSCDMQLLEHVRQLSNEEVRTLLEAHRKGNG
jgi:SagB-type dehydrogenase family enzyme